MPGLPPVQPRHPNPRQPPAAPFQPFPAFNNPQQPSRTPPSPQQPSAPPASGGATGSEKWYPGKLTHVNAKEQKADIEYADGTTAEDVPMSLIRAIGTGSAVGGVLFLDEAYDLEPAKNPEGAAIMAEIMSAAEDHRDKVTIILGGYRDDVEKKLYAHNPGMASRFIDVTFDDFDEDQLHEMWENLVAESKWVAEDGVSRVAARRVARGIGQKNFGNGRALRKQFLAAIEEAKQEYFGAAGSDVEPKLKIEHVIGKEPTRTNLPGLDKALLELEGKTGLASVKKEVQELVDLARNNWHKELRAEKIDAPQLNRLFLGNPGTGKTSIAKLYGKILAELRLLSKGTVVVKTASDFKGSVVGESEKQTGSILGLAQGQVLLIDEAYSLNDGGGGSGGGAYGTAVLDTIVEKVQGNPGDDIAVIMAGYKAEMLKMLRDQNPGLSRRFNPDSALMFEDFSDSELLKILGSICRADNTRASIVVKRAAIRHLAKRRALPHFGNAGAVITMFTDAKRRMVARCKAAGIDSAQMELAVQDFTGEENPAATDPLTLLEELSDVGNFKTMLMKIGKRIQVKRAQGRTIAGIAKNFVFTGAPGTGKTTVARKMGAILHAYGLLARDDVIVTSAEDLTAEYVGQSKAKVEEQMQAARGGVLFIDEAYELGMGAYGQEAMTKLLAMLTEPEYMGGKTVVVLAGYTDEMHRMLARNPGLKSRFPPDGFVHFPDWDAGKCYELIAQRAARTKPTPYRIAPAAEGALKGGLDLLRNRPGWANARDAHALYEMVEANCEIRVAALEPGQDNEALSTFTLADANTAVAEFVASRPMDLLDEFDGDHVLPVQEASANSAPAAVCVAARQANAQVTTALGAGEAESDQEEANPDQAHDTEDLEAAFQAEAAAALQFEEDSFRELIRIWNESAFDPQSQEETREFEEQLRQRAQKLRGEARKRAEEALAELKRRQKEALERWKKAEAERKAREEAERVRLQAIRDAQERERKEQEALAAKRLEEQRQKELQRIGNCVAGFRWIHEGNGFYRCAGGSHTHQF